MLFALPFLSPLVFIVSAAIAFSGPAMRPRRSAHWAQGAALTAFGLSLANVLVLFVAGSGSTPMIVWDVIGISLRIDALTTIMALLVSGVGWVVVRFSATYLDGEAQQGPFIGWMSLTLASVLLLVQAGSLLVLVVAWIATSIFLQKLLLFYPERVQAQRAAHKKFLTSRFSDVALVLAALLLTFAFGTGDLGELMALAQLSLAEGSGWAVHWAAGFLALAAILKSAQFPTHGWLTEVMETPTPVSALLHAGVINAGGFLLIRFADIMLLAPTVLALLVMIGGFTALLGGLVMLTQSAVKTSLAWSTVGQMGFMILQCGLALFPLALLHIVAHSLYKAHAFLASAGAVEGVAAIKRPGPVAIPNVAAVGKAFVLALGIYALVATSFGVLVGFETKSPQALALGAILIFGVAYLLAQGLADQAPKVLTRKTAVYSVAAAVSYFALQTLAELMMIGTLPATPVPGALEWALIVLAVVSFGLVSIAQALFPLWAYHPAAAGLRVHLSNGLYANALFDRLVRKSTPSTLPS